MGFLPAWLMSKAAWDSPRCLMWGGVSGSFLEGSLGITPAAPGSLHADLVPLSAASHGSGPGRTALAHFHVAFVEICEFNPNP